MATSNAKGTTKIATTTMYMTAATVAVFMTPKRRIRYMRCPPLVRPAPVRVEYASPRKARGHEQTLGLFTSTGRRVPHPEGLIRSQYRRPTLRFPFRHAPDGKSLEVIHDRVFRHNVEAKRANWTLSATCNQSRGVRRS
jgi:hypothetical protein